MSDAQKLTVLIPLRVTDSMALELDTLCVERQSKRPGQVRSFIAEGLRRAAAEKQYQLTPAETIALGQMRELTGIGLNPSDILQAALLFAGQQPLRVIEGGRQE